MMPASITFIFVYALVRFQKRKFLEGENGIFGIYIDYSQFAISATLCNLECDVKSISRKLLLHRTKIYIC